MHLKCRKRVSSEGVGTGDDSCRGEAGQKDLLIGWVHQSMVAKQSKQVDRLRASNDW